MLCVCMHVLWSCFLHLGGPKYQVAHYDVGSDIFAGTKLLKTIRYKFKSHSPCHLLLSKQKEKQNVCYIQQVSFVTAVLILIRTQIFSLNSTK